MVHGFLSRLHTCPGDATGQSSRCERLRRRHAATPRVRGPERPRGLRPAVCSCRNETTRISTCAPFCSSLLPGCALTLWNNRVDRQRRVNCPSLPANQRPKVRLGPHGVSARRGGGQRAPTSVPPSLRRTKVGATHTHTHAHTSDVHRGNIHTRLNTPISSRDGRPSFSVRDGTEIIRCEMTGYPGVASLGSGAGVTRGLGDTRPAACWHLLRLDSDELRLLSFVLRSPGPRETNDTAALWVWTAKCWDVPWSHRRQRSARGLPAQLLVPE